MSRIGNSIGARPGIPRAVRPRRTGASVASLVLLVAGLAALAGCGRLGLPFGTAALDFRPTASARPAAPAGLVREAAAQPAAVAPSDWEAVRQRTDQTLLAAAPNAVLDWENPATGNGGTITPAAPAEGSCRAFTTTLSDLRGVRRYRVEACERPGGRWELTRVTPDDAALL